MANEKHLLNDLTHNKFIVKNLLLYTKNVKRAIGSILFLCIILLFFNFGAKYAPDNMFITKINNSTLIDKDSYHEEVKIKLNQSLVYEVHSYMQRVAPNNKLDAKLLVDLCKQYDIDVTFVLAQGILESHLGTKGVAIRTNSVWNVGAYDDGRILHKYEHPNQSIEPYLILLRQKYLGENKKIHDLLKDRSFVNLNGYRYASAPTYEAHLRMYIININMNTTISMYQDLMKLPSEKMVEYFVPTNNIQNNALLTSNMN